MELRVLRYFLAVAREENISRAAEALHTAQPSLSRQLRELEQDGFLRRKVYEQVPLRVEYTLTPLGESFAPLLHAMLQWSQEHLEELGGAIEKSKEQ